MASTNLARRSCSGVWFGPGLRDPELSDLLAFLGSRNGVAVIQWPRDLLHLDLLSRMGLPALLLVHPSSSTVPPEGPLLRSVAHAAQEAEIRRNMTILSESAGRRRLAGGPPVLDLEGQIRAGDGRVRLPPWGRSLAHPLLTRFGQGVPDSLLEQALAESSAEKSRNLERWLPRLSRLVNPLGIEVANRGQMHHAMRWCVSSPSVEIS